MGVGYGLLGYTLLVDWLLIRKIQHFYLVKYKNRKKITKLALSGTFLFLASIAFSIHSEESEIYLSPPGMRLIKEPSLVIPADHNYANRSMPLPVYRDSSGNPATGWSDKYIEIRRFASDQSAWIYFRDVDLQRSVLKQTAGERDFYRFWPVGTAIIIEIYKGDALQKETDKLIDIAAMSKIEAAGNSFLDAFYPVNWIYSRFDSDGNPSLTSEKVRECHQCHSIAFHLTGDLIFTQFP